MKNILTRVTNLFTHREPLRPVRFYLKFEVSKPDILCGSLFSPYKHPVALALNQHLRLDSSCEARLTFNIAPWNYPLVRLVTGESTLDYGYYCYLRMGEFTHEFCKLYAKSYTYDVEPYTELVPILDAKLLQLFKPNLIFDSTKD